MQRRFSALFALAMLGFIGCAPSATERLIGQWKFDAAKPAAATDEKPSGLDAAKSALLGVASAIIEPEIEFKRDHTLTMSFAFGAPASGPWKWKVVEEEGNQATVEIYDTRDYLLGNPRLTFLDNDHIQFAPLGNAKMGVFRRVKAE